MSAVMTTLTVAPTPYCCRHSGRSTAFRCRAPPLPHRTRPGTRRLACVDYDVLPAVAASIAAFTAGFPLDTVKIQTQTGKLGARTNPMAGYRESLLVCVATSLTYFALFELLGPLCVPARAAVSTCFSCLVKVPGKSVTKLLQNQDHDNAVDAVRATLRDLGWRGFFRGLTPYIAGDVPENVLRFVLYGLLSAHLQSALAVGLVTGVAVALATQPIDMLQTQVICNYKQELRLGEVEYYKGTPYALLSCSLQTCVFYVVNASLAAAA